MQGHSNDCVLSVAGFFLALLSFFMFRVSLKRNSYLMQEIDTVCLLLKLLPFCFLILSLKLFGKFFLCVEEWLKKIARNVRDKHKKNDKRGLFCNLKRMLLSFLFIFYAAKSETHAFDTSISSFLFHILYYCILLIAYLLAIWSLVRNLADTESLAIYYNSSKLSKYCSYTFDFVIFVFLFWFFFRGGIFDVDNAGQSSGYIYYIVSYIINKLP